MSSAVRNDQTETSVDSALALAFHGFDAVTGQTCEVWFIKGDFLYEVSTYKEPWAQRNNVHLAIYINP
jgi:hypothetical protein